MDKLSIDEQEDNLEPVPHTHEAKGIEDQLFEWDGWQDDDTAAFTFYKVKLKVPMGKFPVGSEFLSAYVDYGRSLLALYVADGPMVNGAGNIKEVYKAHLTVSLTELPLTEE